jgi:hypothetical protein
MAVNTDTDLPLGEIPGGRPRPGRPPATPGCKDAIGGQKVPGMAIDEEAPASFRAQGDPATTCTRVTSKEESSCK